MSVHAAADAGATVASGGRAGLAAPAAEQMAGGASCSSLFLWAYEAFALWDSPWWTAWIALGYFAAAFVIDGFFRGAAFCKYVCPIGQFNFVQSLVSPLEVKVRDPPLSAHRAGPRIASAAETTFPAASCTCSSPGKSGNLDCTFVSTAFTPAHMTTSASWPECPGKELWHESLSLRSRPVQPTPDLAALVAVLVFGASSMPRGWSPRFWSGKIS